MSLLSRALLTSLVLVTLAIPALAQQTASGIIRGKVQNATNGASLENVTVQIQGTNRLAVTDAYGEYVFRDVPAGEVTLLANYVGETQQKLTVTVAEGATATQDISFRESGATRRDKDGVVQLDPYIVNVERYQNARAIAIASERTSVNIKNVVAVDQFGEIPSGNVGEFVKFLPGIQIDYGASNGNNQGYSENRANGVSVRGFGPEDTTIMIDGFPVSATLPGNLTRQVGLDQLSINNASRIELTKVATPDMPANSIGGQINLITKSSFEFPRPVFDASIFFNINSQYFDLEKTPGPVNKKTLKTSPGVNFSASYPFTKNFGMTVSGSILQEFSQNYRAQPVWNNSWNNSFNPTSYVNSSGLPVSLSNPIMTRYQVTDAPAITDTKSANIRADWKPTPNQTLKANIQYSTYETAEAQRRLDFRPALATGADWGPNRTVGTTANSTTAMSITTRDRLGDTVSGSLNYDANLLGWKIAAGGSVSKSISDFEDESNGHYSGLDMSFNPGKVAIYYGANGIPYDVDTWSRGTNQVLRDYTQIANWNVADTKALSGETHNERTLGVYKVDFSRPLDFIPFLERNPITFSFGARRDEDENVKNGRGTGYRQVLKPGATFVTADVADDSYVGASPGFGLAPQQWASTYKLYELNKANDIFMEPTSGSDAVENYNSATNQAKDLKETTTGYYAMLNGSFLNNRLTVLAGARQEGKTRVGRTPLNISKWAYVKNTDGSVYANALYPNGVRFDQTSSPLFATTQAGIDLRAALTAAGIAFPTAAYGTTGSDLASAKLARLPLQEVNQKVTGDPSYSINTAYKLTDKIDLKVAYSRSFKQQPLEDGAVGVISGNTLTIVEYTPTEQAANNGALGQISVANPGLKPETSDNWDFEIAYYTDTGGKLTLSYYTKEVTNATQNFTTYSGSTEFDQALTALNLEPSEYQDWRIATSANSATVQKTSGYEVFVSQDFGILGNWGRRFSAFASFAATDFPPPSAPVPYTITNPNGTTSTLTPAVATVKLRANRFGGAGLQYSGDRFGLQIRGTYRNENQVPGTNAATLNDGSEMRRMQPAETRVDINASYMINKTYSVYVSARDVLNGERAEEWLHSTGVIPSFAVYNDLKRFGTSWTVGVKGHW